MFSEFDLGMAMLVAGIVGYRDNRIIIYSGAYIHVERHYKCPKGCEFPFQRVWGKEARLIFAGQEI